MNNIQTGLMITAIGMGLVFGMIMVLWGMIVLLVKWTTKKASPETVEVEVDNSESVVIAQPNDYKQKAAAAAVAFALAQPTERQASHISSDEINLWQASTRVKQIQNQTRRGHHS